jgi:PhzF family phenazine biosynthesis protein
MPTIPLYQVDAFTDRPFGGNPAAVCPLDEWLPDDVMQSIAMENNLSETAFFVAEGNGFRLRWFTPTNEVALCGHATLATAFTLFEKLGYAEDSIQFVTQQIGTLEVRRDGQLIVMDFPALAAEETAAPDGLVEAIGDIKPEAFLRAVKNMAVLTDEAAVRSVVPDLEYIKHMEGYGLIVTAPGTDTDCVCRYFGPQAGVDEDPVTGSAHCTLVPYWADRLGKTEIHSRQISARSGDVYCKLNGDRVLMAGHGKLVIEGTFSF